MDFKCQTIALVREKKSQNCYTEFTEAHLKWLEKKQTNSNITTRNLV